MTDVRLHDLRRTVMTSAAAAGVGTYVLRDLLGHKTTTMADRYVRAVGNPVRRRTGTGGRADGRHDARQGRGSALAGPKGWHQLTACNRLRAIVVLPNAGLPR